MRFKNYITEYGIPPGTKVGFDKKIFKKIVDLIVSFDPETLTEQQRNNILNIILAFDMHTDTEEIKEDETFDKISKLYLPKLNKWYNTHKDFFDKSSLIKII